MNEVGFMFPHGRMVIISRKLQQIILISFHKMPHMKTGAYGLNTSCRKPCSPVGYTVVCFWRLFHGNMYCNLCFWYSTDYFSGGHMKRRPRRKRKSHLCGDNIHSYCTMNFNTKNICLQIYTCPTYCIFWLTCQYDVSEYLDILDYIDVLFFLNVLVIK